MLKEASVADMSKLKIPKDSRVLVNRGRGNDELAPAEDLYREMMGHKATLEKVLGKGSVEAHNRAYLDCGFTSRFREQIKTSQDAMRRLEEIAKSSKVADIYLVCYEGPTKACHRRILMRIAEEEFGADIEISGVEPAG